MRILRKTSLVFLLSLFFVAGHTQTPESILDSVNAGRKPEKIFTHFDKTFYQPGETIWFKTYITVDGRPGSFSSVVKAELINETGKVITSQIMPVTVGSASGSMSLPYNLSYGTYVFRLYTQHMLNTSADNFYYKPIPVLSSAVDFDKAAPVTDISLRFFTEGGVFLTDELNMLAFMATDQQGKPVTVSGTIKDSGGKEIVSFTTEYNGMGKIEITPKKGEQYTAQYILPSGVSRSVLLPAAIDEGTNLLVVDEVLKKRLIVNSRSSATKQKPTYILGEMDQTVIFKIDISKNNGHYMGKLPVQDLPGGLLHIAVFNAGNEVLAERTCFVNSRKDTVEALLMPISTGTGKRNENNFDFMLPDSLEGTFSVSVTDISQTQLPVPADNIIVATLVTSSLKSVGNNPLYDAGQLTGTEKNDAVDLLLLTHQYKWNWEALTKLAIVKLPSADENYIPLRGKAYADRNNKPVLPGADLAFLIQTKDSAVNSFTITTDNDGYFETPGLFYEDTALIYVKNNTDKNRDKKVQLEILSSALTEKYSLPVQKDIIEAQVPVFLKTTDQLKTKPVIAVQPVIDFDTTAKMLEELVVISKVKNPTQLLEKRYSKGLFSGSARTTIDFVNDKPSYLGGNIFDYLKGRYSYMQVMGNYPNYMLVYRNMKSLGSGTFIPMSLYLDEMQVDASMLISVPMKDIALVRIYTSGITGTGGSLVVYTKKGEDAGGSSLYENMSKFTLPGFSTTHSFYSPDYGPAAKTVIKNDTRKTLYWNPSLTYIPEDGKLPVSFFNNDQCREYKIVVQGFTMDGKLVYMEKIVR